ncbi:Hydroxyindole-O-methyltransferase [Handroanthus impetiginosus]|uniref:Hydroxyindole-O-methyltransferase n=1 Tax=Handroanthus impetiginosus TaxID=429701 RepID=A0A2G9I925_9LAMI|nr:Hydroxyindole-O-methyltransferase [Handroanthus impetiginosus]
MALFDGVKYSTNELIDAQAHVWNHIFNYINSMSLKCAIQLRIPDIIHKNSKPMMLSQLVDALPINKVKSHSIYRLMRILVHSKFFVKDKISEDDHEEDGYWLTPASHLLLRDEPLSMAPFVLATLDPVLIDPWHHAGIWFQNETPSSFATKHGMMLFEYAGIDQRWNQLFNEAMASDARLVASVITKECKEVFEGLKSLVDVGGGTGTMARAISDAFPGLKCIVLELPHVVAGLEGENNLTFVGGDMFKSIPHADAVFLKPWIFHDWTDDESIKLLKICKEAIIPSKDKGGKVIIVEMVVDDHKEDHEATETQLLFDMLMMIEVNGKERTQKEWANLFFAAGFTTHKITPLLGLRSIIEVFP